MQLPDRMQSEFEAKIREIGIPPCPLLLREIHQQLGQEAPDLRRVAVSISSDVAISASLIALANSPFFGGMRVRTVHDALLKLGLLITAQAVAGILLQNLFPKTPTMERFWHASGGIARISAWLAREFSSRRVGSEDAYTFGLFRDCGIALMLQHVDRYPEALQLANADAVRSFTAVEESICRLNHAEVGAMMAESWLLAEEFVTAIRYHHAYPQIMEGSGVALSETSKGLVATALLAERLFQQATGLSATCEWQKGSNMALAYYALSEETLRELLDACKSQGILTSS